MQIVRFGTIGDRLVPGVSCRKPFRPEGVTLNLLRNYSELRNKHIRYRLISASAEVGDQQSGGRAVYEPDAAQIFPVK